MIQPITDLPWTGERLVTILPPTNETALEHLHRYLLAKPLSASKNVLDIASGEGYGSYILAQTASNVVGVDIAPEAVAHANYKYGSSKIQFKVGTCLQIPCSDKEFDVVVSFETIEHIGEHEDFCRELKRVLKPEGICIISTPNTTIYNGDGPTKNTFHVKELTDKEFETLLKSQFKNVRIFKQKCAAGSLIFSADELDSCIQGEFTGDYVEQQFTQGLNHAVYAVAVCSDAAIPPIHVGLFSANRDLFSDLGCLTHSYELHESSFAEKNTLIANLKNELSVTKEERHSAQKMYTELINSHTQLTSEYHALSKQNKQLQKKLKLIFKQLTTSRKYGKTIERAVANWNRRSWFKRAFHKLRLKI